MASPPPRPRSPRADLSPGTLLAGRYRVERLLGQGGLGLVVLALDTQQGQRPVAVKLLNRAALGLGTPALPDTPSKRGVALKRFQREAQALLGLRPHPHLIPVLALAEHGPGPGPGEPALVLEFMPGGSLQGLLDTRGPLTPGETQSLGIALARALAHVHAHGLLHRDLKPDNVLFDGEGQPRLGDFGLTRELDPARSQTQLTRSRQFLGTPGYWAPELARGELGAVGPCTDVYGLGALLYAALTGAGPHGQPADLIAAIRVLDDDPLPPSARRDPQLEPVPEWLDRLVQQAVARDPADRPPSAAALAEALAGGAAGDGERGAGSQRASLSFAALGALALLALAIGVSAQILGQSPGQAPGQTPGQSPGPSPGTSPGPLVIGGRQGGTGPGLGAVERRVLRQAWTQTLDRRQEPQIVLALVEPLLAERPDDPELQLLRARAQLLAGQPRSAAAVAADVLRHDPSNPMARTLLGFGAADRGELREAIALWLEVLRHSNSPHDPQALGLALEGLLSQGIRLQESELDLPALRQRLPRGQSWGRALEAALRVLDGDPQGPEWTQLALTLEPDSAPANWAQAALHAKAGDHAQALPHAYRAATRGVSAPFRDAWLLAALAESRLGRPRAALEIFRAQRPLRTGLATKAHLEVRCLIAIGALTRAQRRLDQALAELESPQPGLEHLRAVVSSGLPRDSRSLSAAGLAPASVQEALGALLELSRVARSPSDPQERAAVRAQLQAVLAAPGLPQDVKGEACLLYAGWVVSGDLEEAHDWLARGRQLLPAESSRTLFVAALAAYHGQDYDQARQQLKRLLELSPGFQVGQLMLVRALLRAAAQNPGQRAALAAEAAELLGAVLALSPQRHEAHVFLAASQEAQGQREQARRTRLALLNNPYVELTTLVILARELSSRAELRDLLRDVLEHADRRREDARDPREQALLTRWLAKLLFVEGRAGEAERLLERQLAVHPDDVMSRYLLRQLQELAARAGRR